MTGYEVLGVPMILFMVLVAPIWVIMHYRSLNKSSRSLNEDDRESLDSMLAKVDKLADRIGSLESILDADHPDWRKKRGEEA